MWHEFITFDPYAKPEQREAVELVLASFGDSIHYTRPLHIIIHSSAPNTEYGAPEAQFKAADPMQIRLSPSYFARKMEDQAAVLFHELMHYEMVEHYAYEHLYPRRFRYDPLRDFEIAVSFVLGEVLGWMETIKRFPHAEVYLDYYDATFASLNSTTNQELADMISAPRFSAMRTLRSVTYIMVILVLYEVLFEDNTFISPYTQFQSTVFTQHYQGLCTILRAFKDQPYSEESISKFHEELRSVLRLFLDALHH